MKINFWKNELLDFVKKKILKNVSLDFVKNNFSEKCVIRSKEYLLVLV